MGLPSGQQQAWPSQPEAPIDEEGEGGKGKGTDPTMGDVAAAVSAAVGADWDESWETGSTAPAPSPPTPLPGALLLPTARSWMPEGLQDLRDLRQRQDSREPDTSLVHLEASLKGVLIELVERWTQAREELWNRDMRPCWVTERELEAANNSVERLRPRSLLGRVREALGRSRAA